MAMQKPYNEADETLGLIVMILEQRSVLRLQK